MISTLTKSSRTTTPAYHSARELFTPDNPAPAVRLVLAQEGITRPHLDDIAMALQKVAELSPEHLMRTARVVETQLSGLGKLVEPLRQRGVTDVCVNPDGTTWIDTGNGMQLFAAPPYNPEQLRSLAVDLATACSARLDDAHPFADGILTDLPGGIDADALRLHAALAPPVGGGAAISLRLLQHSSHALEDLRQSGAIAEPLAGPVARLVASRRNMLVSGGTGTGKTTLLAALLGSCPPQERIIVVEDTRELMPRHRNLVTMTARTPNADGHGRLSMQDLVRHSLRMRPDRLVVGEVRGAEIADLLVALNTGHAGSAGTIHANSAEAVPGRLIALGAMAGLQPRALAHQAADGIDVILHMQRHGRQRRLAHISTLELHDGELATRCVWNDAPQPGWEAFVEELEHVR